MFIPKEGKKEIYLTFDDGPNPDSTEIILDILKKQEVQATFFCLGEKVEKHQAIFKLIQNNHAVGNHGYSHENGLFMNAKKFISNIDKAHELIKSPFFRPPYGKINPFQYHVIKQKYNLVLWTDMPGDFDASVSKERLLKRLLNTIKPSRVVVLHDDRRVMDKLIYALPKFIEEAKRQGYTFKMIC